MVFKCWCVGDASTDLYMMKTIYYLMETQIRKEEEYIQILQKIGLNHSDATVYFALLKEGPKGSTVYELVHHFEGALKRTTIYSILRKLIVIGCVKEGGARDNERKATVFIATKPEKFFKKLISEKEKELEKLKKIKENYVEYLDLIYQKGIEHSLDEIDEILHPYLLPLVNKGWTITSFSQTKGMPMFEYEVYDIMFKPKRYRYINEVSFHAFIFDYDIENNENGLAFFIRGLKKKTNEVIKYFSQLKEYSLEDTTLTFFNKVYPGFHLKVKLEELQRSKYYEKIPDQVRTYWKEEEKVEHVKIKSGRNKTDDDDFTTTGKAIDSATIEIWQAVSIPVGNKLFFLWAESHKLLKTMIEPIFKIEGIR